MAHYIHNFVLTFPGICYNTRFCTIVIMAISKQQEAVIAKIVSYSPATWLFACESEALKIPEEDRAQFGKILLGAMDVYKSKVQNVIPILKRGPNLNPEVNMRAWAMMHARFLARLFIKHVSKVVYLRSNED